MKALSAFLSAFSVLLLAMSLTSLAVSQRPGLLLCWAVLPLGMLILQRPRKRELLRRRICTPLPPAGGEGRPTWGRKRPLADQLWFMLMLVC